MAEVPRTRGPGFSPLPSRPSPRPVSGATAKVKKLTEEALNEMLQTLPEDSFVKPESGQLLVRSIRTLTPQQKVNLFTLIPPEQLPSYDTPLINEAIEEKQRYTLENICNSPVYRHPNLGVSLPPIADVYALDPLEVKQYIDRLSTRVFEIIMDVNYHPTDKRLKYPLKNPVAMAVLLTLYSFVEVVQCDTQTLFQLKDNIINLMSDKVNKLVLAYQTVKKAAIGPLLQLSLPGDKLINDLSQIFPSLPSANTAEDFKKLCSIVINTSIELEVERNNLIKDVSEYQGSERKFLAPFKTFEPADIVVSGPAFGQEEEWIAAIVKEKQEMRLYSYLVEKTKDYLAPYLSGKITRATEDETVGDLKDSFLSDFHREFQNVPLPSDAEVEHFVFNAYLKIGGRGINLKNSENAATFYREQAVFAITEQKRNWEDASATLSGQAYEIDQEIKSHLTTFIAALQHALKLDFPSMHLTDEEIGRLANFTLYNPTTPLPPNWRHT